MYKNKGDFCLIFHHGRRDSLMNDKIYSKRFYKIHQPNRFMDEKYFYDENGRLVLHQREYGSSVWMYSGDRTVLYEISGPTMTYSESRTVQGFPFSNLTCTIPRKYRSVVKER